MNKLLILFLVGIINNIYAQSVQFSGEVIPGGLLFGKGEAIKSIELDGENINFDNKGNFVIGFDRDDSLSHLLIIELEGKTILKNLVLKPRKYKIQRINRMEKKYVSPPKEVLNRIKEERKLTQKAKSNIGKIKSALYDSGFLRPIKGGRISGVFGSQRILNGIPKNVHNGLDIAVPTGTPVKAMADGKVIYSADNFYYAGNYILIDHGLGLNSLYLHLNKSNVEEGQVVKRGEIIGSVGTTGRSTGPHLHWTVQWYNKRVDPISVFGFMED